MSSKKSKIYVSNIDKTNAKYRTSGFASSDDIELEKILKDMIPKYTVKKKLPKHYSNELIPTQPKRQSSQNRIDDISNEEFQRMINRLPNETDKVGEINNAPYDKEGSLGLFGRNFAHACVIAAYIEYIKLKLREKRLKTLDQYFIMGPEFLEIRVKNKTRPLAMRDGKTIPQKRHRIYLVPVNYSFHWILLVFFPKLDQNANKMKGSLINTNKVVVLNSLIDYAKGDTKTTIKNAINDTQKWFKRIFPESEELLDGDWNNENNIIHANVPQQGGSSNDCGYYVMYFIETIVKNEYQSAKQFQSMGSWNAEKAKKQRQKVTDVMKEYSVI